MGEVDRRAQSRGEWPGVRMTWREGLVGLAVWVRGARVEEPGWRGWRPAPRREGRGDGREEEGRGASVGGRAGGAMREEGRGGGAIGFEGPRCGSGEMKGGLAGILGGSGWWSWC